MKRLNKIISRCHERHKNPFHQRHTSVRPAVYNKGIPYEYTIYHADGKSLKLHTLEEANISFMPIGRAPENDRGPRTFSNDNWIRRFSIPQHTGSWLQRQWRNSWGIQIYTGIPSQKFGAPWHDIHFKYDALCNATDATMTCIQALIDAVVNPLLTITKNGGIRLSFRILDDLHPYNSEDRHYIYSNKSGNRVEYLDIIGEHGLSCWDSRYEILMGNLTDPPIISKEILFTPINLLRDILHQPENGNVNISKLNENSTPVCRVPFTLGTHRLDLAREEFLRQGYTYVSEKNSFHHWTKHNTEDSNKHVVLWERDRTVWVRANSPDLDLPIDATAITEVWEDTGIIPSVNHNQIPISEKIRAIRANELSPLAIKRKHYILSNQTQIDENKQLLDQQSILLPSLFDNGTRVCAIKTYSDWVEWDDVISNFPNNIQICIKTEEQESAKEVERYIIRDDKRSVGWWKPRSHLWEQVRELPQDELNANPFKLGNVCIDSERCDALEEKGGNPTESICPQCPVNEMCQEQGYLAQSKNLKRANYLFLSNPDLFINPRYSKLAEELLEPIDNNYRFCIIDEPKSHDLFLRCELSIDRLSEWTENWHGEPLGNLANFLLNTLQLRGKFYGDSVRRIRSAIQAFQTQEDVIVKQMCETHIKCRIVEQPYVDPETDKVLAKYTIKFENDIDVYIPLDNQAAHILKDNSIPFLHLQSIVVDKDIRIPMTLSQAIQLGVLKIETVTDIQNIQTVCTNPNWTVWHQLKRFFEHYTRDEDARVRWDKKVLEFWIPPILHPNVKQLFIKSTTLYEQHLNRAFPDEKVRVAYLELPSWHKENKIFQIQTGIYPREMILDYDRNWDVIGISPIGLNFYKGIIDEIEKDVNVVHAVITYVAGIKQLSEIVKRDNVYLIKFSDNMDNLDSILEKVQVIWIVGAPEPPQGTIWRQGQILYGNDDTPLNYEKDKAYGLYTDERLQNIYEQNIDVLLRPILNCDTFNRSQGRKVVLLTSINLAGISDRTETVHFDWEDFEIAGGLEKLPEVVAKRKDYEKERDCLTAKSSREKVEEVYGCSSRQANRILQKLRGGAPLRVPYRIQILNLLADGNKKTAELTSTIDGNPEAVKNELKRLIDKGDIVRVQRGVYSKA